MSKPQVIVSTAWRPMSHVFAEADLERLHSFADVVWGRDEPMPQDAFEAALPDASAIVFGTWQWGPDVLEKAGPNLAAVLECSGGHAHPDVDYDYCFQHGIFVGSCAPSFGPQVAEMALGLTLAATRQIAQHDRLFREGDEVYLIKSCTESWMLFDKKVGFVGYGSLGRHLQALLAPFRVNIMAYDPWLPESTLREARIEPASLERLFEECDVVYILAVPTRENKGLITRALMERLKPHAVLAVISRAHLVDFDALTELVLAGRFRAAIDVFPKEPLEKDHPIREATSAVLSAHRAGSVVEGLQDIGRMVVDDLELMFRGLPPRRMQYATPQLRQKLVGK